jgi:hypothetical protein
MDTSIIAAFSAILGTTVGGLTTFLTTFLNQRYAMHRDILAEANPDSSRFKCSVAPPTEPEQRSTATPPSSSAYDC